MDKKIFEGKDLDEALQMAAESLGIAEPDLDYEILEQGRRGLFGIGAKSVRIRVMPPISPLEPQAAELLGVDPRPAAGSRGGRRRRGRSDRERPAGPRGNEQQRSRRPRREKRPRSEKPSGPPPEPVSEADLLKVQSTLQEMIDLMGLELKAEAEADGAGIQLHMSGSDEGLLDDRDSELASSLQFVLNRMARRTWPEVGRIRLGDNGRSSGRDDEVIELVREVAQQVTQTGEPKQLHPMNAYERRLVHLTIRKTNGLGSRSDGNGPLKRVQIFKQEKKEGGRSGRPGRSRSRRRGRGRRGGAGRSGQAKGNPSGPTDPGQTGQE